MTEYMLIRSRRRTLTIYIRDGGVEVRAPLKMPKGDIDSFVASKERWIKDKRAKSRERSARREAFTLNYGGSLTLRGAEYPLIAEAGTRAGFDGERFYLPPGFAPGRIKQTVVRIYRQLAEQHIARRVAHFAGQMKLVPSAVRINSAKTRWGSCSAKKSLNFSWKLIMAGDELIDYVVVHELAHIIEMNHSPRFWAIVAGVTPDYKERKARLKDLQRRLSGEDWEL